MLRTRAAFMRKADRIEAEECQIDRVIELSPSEFDSFCGNLFQSKDFIKENIDDMYVGADFTRHCILVMGQDRPHGILVEAQGYDYARYSAFLPNARAFVSSEIKQIADRVIAEGKENATEDGIWVRDLHDIEQNFGVIITPNNGIGTMLLDELKNSPEITDLTVDDGWLVMTVAPAPLLTSEREMELLDRLIGYVGEYFSGSELYDILHHTLEIGHDEMEALGFSLQDYYDAPNMEPTM